MTQKYYVNVHYDVVLQAEVIAHSEEEAHRLAIGQTEPMSLDDGDICDITTCTTQIDKISE